MRRLVAAFSASVLSLVLTATALSAQAPSVIIYPRSSTYQPNTELEVTIEYCSTTDYFDGPPGVQFNGFDYSGSFNYQSGYRSECVDFGTATGTVTLDAGQNTLESWIATSSSFGQDAVVYTVNVAEAPVVTPDAEPLSVSPTVGAIHRFAIYNPGYVGRTFDLAATCSGSASGCSVQGSLYLDAGQTGYVVVTYSVAGTLNQSGSVVLTATDQNASVDDTGSLSIKVAPSSPVIERALCLTIATGGNAAYECGDLRIVHTLPAVRTLGQTRTPTLIYSSQHAHPFPLLHSDVTFAAWETRPDSVIATVRVNGQQMDRRSWGGSQWGSTGQAITRRVAAGFPFDTLTGLYDYQLEIGKRTGGNYVAIRTESGTLPIVNRANSAFGAGWWLAGFEKLQFLAGGAVLWIGGDGSLRRYEEAGTLGSETVYLATPVDGPDSLFYNPGSAQYRRLLKGGGTVRFNSTGFHIQTVSRLGHYTEFVPDGQNRLATINVPPDTSALSYTFTYGGAAGTLSAIAAPDIVGGAGRTTAIGTNGARIQSILDPGNAALVSFAFDASYANRIVTTTQGPARASFTYDAAGRLTQDSVYALSGPSPYWIRQTFCSADVRGLAGTCSSTLPHPDSAYTRYDGPREASDSADISDFWLDRFGSVTQVRDPYGYRTVVARTDPRWPALPTRLQSPNGRIVAASYDRRGNVASTTDSSRYFTGQHATTSYDWNQRWDELASVTLPNGQVTQFGVDSSNGNRLWVGDARGSASRTTFEYSYGLLEAIVLPGGARTTVTYGTLANPSGVTTALGWKTYYNEDALGRVTLIRSPLGPDTSSSNYRSDTTAYDPMGRVVRTASYGPAFGYMSAQTLTVVNTFDSLGHLRQVDRSPVTGAPGGVLSTQWTYDFAGRTVTEVAPDGNTDSTFYDPAGNVTRSRDRRGLSVTMVYDRANRLRQRIAQPVNYPKGTAGLVQLAGTRHTYPWFFTNASDSSLDIAGDTAVFSYDSVGNLIAADNGDARIRRSYFKDANIRTDSLWIRTVFGSDFTSHAYGLAYDYDVNGRLQTLRHPAQLAPRSSSVADSVVYQYDDYTGAVVDVTDLMNNHFGFSYNWRGERTKTSMPGAVYDSATFDLDGRLTLNRVYQSSSSTYAFPQTVIRNTSLGYQDPARVFRAANAEGWRDTTTAYYSGLGNLSRHNYVQRPSITDGSERVVAVQELATDPLGSTSSRSDSSSIQANWGYTTPGTSAKAMWFTAAGRLRKIVDDSYRTDSIVYDSAGNSVFAYTSGSSFWPSGWREDRASYYDGLNRLRVSEWRRGLWVPSNGGIGEGGQWLMAAEEYRYDALGRRVLARAQRDCWESTNLLDPCKFGTVRRTVWDGAQELWEIQMPDSAYGGSWRENDTAVVALGYTCSTCSPYSPGYFDPNPRFGRVGYTHATGIDRPLSIARFGYRDWPYPQDTGLTWTPFVVVPHWNWRGQADYGLFADGGTKRCQSGGTRCVLTRWRHRAMAQSQDGDGTLGDGSGRTYVWLGSLTEDKEDATRTVYRRNRYFDPATGQFTQEDPIGLAGGLNLYGFAGGDPVNFSDPFGLCRDNAGNELPPDQCRSVTSHEGHSVFRAAVGQGQWTYTLGTTRGMQEKEPWDKIGDCTDFVEASMRAAGFPATASSWGDRPATFQFKANTNYRLLGSSEQLQQGDVVIHEGHAGVTNGRRAADGRIRAWQNGESLGTGWMWFHKNAVVYRRLVPGAP